RGGGGFRRLVRPDHWKRRPQGAWGIVLKPSRPLRALLLSLACSAALAAQAQTVPRIDIPAGDLAAALDAYARQSGTQLVYRADQLKGARSSAVQGQAASPQALDALLKGS